MTLAEELLLCTIGDDGYIASSHKAAAAIGGALIAELVLTGRARVDGDALAPADATPLGDPLIDELIEALQDPNATKLRAGSMMPIFGQQAFPRVHESVIAAGAVQIEQGGRSWMYVVRKPDTYRLTPVGEEPRRRVREGLLGTHRVDDRTAALAALLVTTGYHKVLIPKDQRPAAAQRAQAFAAGDGVTAAVADAIGAIGASVQPVPTTA